MKPSSSRVSSSFRPAHFDANEIRFELPESNLTLASSKALPPSSPSGHHTHAQDFVFPQRLQGGLGNSGHGDGFAEGIKNLYGVALAAIGREMVVHERNEVTAAQPVLRQVARHDSIGV